MKDIRFLATTILAMAATFAFVAQSAHGIQCGDTIMTDTKLYSNIGPCPGDGLTIGTSNVTLDLNGHAIIGTFNGTGVMVAAPPNSISGITIKGPGSISGFKVGMLIGMAGDVVVHGLTLVGNNTGIVAGGTTFEIRVFNNLIAGRNQKTVGLDFTNNADIHIFNNTLRGHSEAIRLFLTRGTFIGENLITLNETGIYSDFTGCLNVRGNEVTHNRGDAIRVFGMGSPSGQASAASTTTTTMAASSTDIKRVQEKCISLPDAEGNLTQWNVVQGNTVRSNGGNGIFVVLPVQALVEDNIVSRNSGKGISVEAAPFAETGAVQVIGNFLSGDGTDLFWDGVGANNCWHRNVFRTSSPQTLPGCE